MMSPLFDPELSRQISTCGIVAVLILDRVKDAVPVAQSLVAGGVTAMELTLRTPVALEALEAVRSEVPDMIAGVGTILTPDQVKLAKKSGAQFGVAPGMIPRCSSLRGRLASPSLREWLRRAILKRHLNTNARCSSFSPQNLAVVCLI
jgi:2-dehydro-3-deoxyphosphogluconate aldolase / (4S)-4-hydroxy-2-oxoglutarate aldolase